MLSIRKYWSKSTHIIMSSIPSILEETSRSLVSNVTETPKTPAYLCLAIAGGGGHAISALASTPGASAILLEGTVAYDRRSMQTYVGGQELSKHKFVSKESAALLARAAVRRAMQYRHALRDYPHCIGLGVTSALITCKERPGRGSFGYICATRADGCQWSCRVGFAPQLRNRIEEDQLMGQLALKAVEQLQRMGKAEITKNDERDIIEDVSFVDNNLSDEAFAAAERILAGVTDAVLLLPNEDKSSFIAMTDPILPSSSLVFPGSFNPPHDGHMTLANVAADSFSENETTPVFMELSLTNADKPSLDPRSVSQRAQKFLELDNLPTQCGLLLTSAPLFSQKVKALTSFMTPAIDANDKKLGFIIGTDTMRRILDPKYYENSVENMLGAVREMGRVGVRFVVGGRLEQGKNIAKPVFVSGHEELEELPKDVQAMFSIVSEEQFRVDISSSEIRREAAVATDPDK